MITGSSPFTAYTIAWHMPACLAGVAWVYVKSQALIKSALRHLRALDGTASCAAPADTAEHRPGAHAAQPPTCMATTTATPPDPAASASADTLTAAQRRMAELRVADEPSSGGGVKNGACVHACCGDGLGPGEGSGTDVAIEIEERRKAEPAVSPAAAEPRPGEASDPAERSAGSAAAAEAAVSATAAAAASNASKGPGGATAQAKRSKLKASPMRHTPERVLWRWCNHNMPKAWDLDLELPEDSGGGGVLSREGLAIVLDSGEWWRQMVCPRTCFLHMPCHTVLSRTFLDLRSGNSLDAVLSSGRIGCRCSAECCRTELVSDRGV